MIKTFNKMGTEGIYLNTIKAMYDRPTANIIFNSEKLRAFSQRSNTRHRCPLSPPAFKIILAVSARSIRQEKE